MRVIPGAQHEESSEGGGTEAFILGAGFSKAVSGHMPLVDEINIALQWAEDYGLAGLDFEEQLTFLAQNQPWLTEAQNLRNRAEFLEQSSRLERALDASQCKVLADPMPGWFRDLVDDWIRHGPWIVSLNYDTLVEHAYTEILPAEEGRVLAHSAYYAIPIQGALSRTQLVPSPHRGEGVGRLIKLHGSLNC